MGLLVTKTSGTVVGRLVGGSASGVLVAAAAVESGCGELHLRSRRIASGCSTTSYCYTVVATVVSEFVVKIYVSYMMNSATATAQR